MFQSESSVRGCVEGFSSDAAGVVDCCCVCWKLRNCWNS